MVLSPLEDDASAVPGHHESVLRPFDDVTLGRSLNFSYGTLTPAQVRECFDAGDLDRIAAATARLDPTGRLLSNQPMPR